MSGRRQSSMRSLRSDYHYHLPAELIAQTPADRRDGSRLLVVGQHGFEDRRFVEIAELLPANALLVVNDTRVFPARLQTRKATGGAVELLFVEPVAAPDVADADARVDAGPAGGDHVYWRCMARSSKKLGAGTDLAVEGADGVSIRVVAGRGADSLVTVRVPGDAYALLERLGEVPLPPYIERPAGTSPADAERYQTVYARERGAVAAPTAGLHFTDDLLAALGRRGVETAAVTLHVGPGTFAPMRAERLDEHRMHSERYEISEAVAERITRARREGRAIVAVGTTSVRALESAALAARAATGELVRPGRAETDLFIRPGFAFRVVDHLITNFHLPESTLLMLVCAFAGYQRTMAAYRHAVDARYRFFSYGDAMLLPRLTDAE